MVGARKMCNDISNRNRNRNGYSNRSERIVMVSVNVIMFKPEFVGHICRFEPMCPFWCFHPKAEVSDPPSRAARAQRGRSSAARPRTFSAHARRICAAGQESP